MHKILEQLLIRQNNLDLKGGDNDERKKEVKSLWRNDSWFC